jgi:hypothetical protein
MTATINNATNSASVTDHEARENAAKLAVEAQRKRDEAVEAIKAANDAKAGIVLSPRESFRECVLTVNGKGDTVLSDAGKIVAIARDSFKSKIKASIPVKLSDGVTTVMTIDKADGLDRAEAMEVYLRSIADHIKAIRDEIATNPQSYGSNRMTVQAIVAAPLGKNAGLLSL